jgi:NAD dependent epimerase/dehydratase family enzyme
MYSWVHVEDVARAIEWLLEKPELEGVFNLVAPGPVTNAYFMATLRRLTHHRIGLPAPAWLLRLGARMIGTETELILKSRWVMPTKLLDAGFRFQYERLEPALQDIIGRVPRKQYHLF